MYRMMYKSQGSAPAFMEEVKDIGEFLRYRELVAKGMGFATEIVNEKLFLYDRGKEFGIYYAEKGE